MREKVDFVYSVGSDVAMPTVAKVSKELGLPCFVDYETTTICNHKGVLRETLHRRKVEGNIPFQMIESPDEDIRINFPVMMKPSDSQGQRGVVKVGNIEELRHNFYRTIGFSREKKVILESYIDGDEISVNVFFENSELKFYLVSDRMVWDEHPGGIIRKHIIPSVYEKNAEVSEKVRKLVFETIEAIGLKNGPAYFQIKISPDKTPYIIEVTPRLDGCHMWKLIRYSTGIDLLKASMDMLEGKEYNQPEKYTIKPYSLEFLCGKPGSVFYKNNYDISGYESLNWYYEEGKTINPMNGFFEKCGYVIKRES